MTTERQQFSLALGLSAGVNLLLFFLIAWSMAVTQGLTGKSRKTMAVPPLSVPEAPPEMISLVLSPDPEPAGTPQREMITSPDDQPDTPPTNPDTRFISSANMRAASEEAASPDGIAGLATQQGVDKPFLDLRDREFRDGEATPNRPADPLPPQPNPAESSRPPAPPTPPAPNETPPEPVETKPDPEMTPADPSPEIKDQPPEKEPPPAPEEETPAAVPAPPAFRDSASQTLIPLPSPPAPKLRQPSRPPPAPLTRIPDRVPEYSPGTRKAKTLGTISNKGRSSVDATATAEGRFGKLIRTAIEKGWRRRMLGLSSLANPGLVEVEFEVDAKGRISNVKLANPGEANPVMQDCALSAVIEAKLPPPPPELLEELRDNLTGGRMRCSFSFLIY